MDEYNWIDPPVGPYSPPDDIRRWIKELESMPDSEEVRSSIDEATRWLKQRGA